MPSSQSGPGVVEIRVNGQAMLAEQNTTVAVAILRAGVVAFRRSVTGEPRAPLCGMGICGECRATVNGVPDRYTCQTFCQPDMTVETEAL